MARSSCCSVLVWFATCVFMLAVRAAFDPYVIQERMNVVEQGGICFRKANETPFNNIYNLCPKPWSLNARLEEFIQNLSSSHNPPPPMPLIRREIRTLQPIEYRRFIDATKSMKQKTFLDLGMNPAIYKDGEQILSYFDLFSEFHFATISPPDTRGPTSWSWHREQLLRFERALNLAVEGENNVALPYVDFTLDAYLPEPRDSVLWSEFVLGTCGCDTQTLEDELHLQTASGNQSICEYEGSSLGAPFTDWTNPEAATFACMTTDQFRSCSYPLENRTIPTPFLPNELQTILDMDTFVEFSTNLCITYDHDHLHDFVFPHNTLKKMCAIADPFSFLLHSSLDMAWEIFRQMAQVSSPEDDYPTSDDSDLVVSCKHASSPLTPFANMTVADGLSHHYTNDYYVYEPVPTSCTRDYDCAGSEFLWCEHTIVKKCLSKVKPGGICTGLPDRACFRSTCRAQRDGKERCISESAPSSGRPDPKQMNAFEA